MEKGRSKTKAKKSTITFECDNDTLETLKDIAKLAGVSLDQTVSVILASFCIEEKKKRVTHSDEPHIELWTMDGDKKIKKQKVRMSQFSDSSFGLGDK